MGEALSVDARNWFDKDELAVCPFCGKRAAPRQDDDVSVCLECKAVWRLEDGQPKRIG
jgi:ribosomal protein L37AE/L43A